MKQRQPKIHVLIPDGESHLLLEVISCLSESNCLVITVMSSKQENPMRFSRYIDNYSYYPPSSVEDWIGYINREVEKREIDVIMPIFEIGIRALIQNRQLLICQDKLLHWASIQHFDTAIDKWKLYEHMSRAGISCPKTYRLETDTPVNFMDFPIIVKPTKGYGGGLEVELLNDKNDWDRFYGEKIGLETKFIGQEYIQGGDYCCNVLCLNGEIQHYTIQKGIMWGDKRFGAQLGQEFIYNNEILEISSTLMKSLCWSGVACIDIRFDEDSKDYKIIEINTRYWRSLVGSLASGVNFPLLSIFTHLKGSQLQKPYKEVSFFNLKGLVKYIRTDYKNLLKIRFIWKNTAIKYAVLDPLPMIYKFFTRRWV